MERKILISPRFALFLADPAHKLHVIAAHKSYIILLQVKYIGKRSKTKMDLSIKMYADEVKV